MEGEQEKWNSASKADNLSHDHPATETVPLNEISQETKLLPGDAEKESVHKSPVVNGQDRCETSVEKPEVSAITPLDGGWGWLLVFSSSMLFMLVHGVVYSMGIFFNPLREYFGSSKTQTSWLNSSVIGIYDLIGVIVSPCITRFGFRRAAMFGSVLAATSIFLSSFVNSILTLIVTFGFLGGTGLGFMHIPAVVIVGHYFDKRRSFATGLVCSMGGIGAFIFAPMLNFFITEYGWRGTLMILSGVILNGLVCAYLYRVVDLHTSQRLGVSEIIIEKLAAPGVDSTAEDPLLPQRGEKAAPADDTNSKTLNAEGAVRDGFSGGSNGCLNDNLDTVDGHDDVTNGHVVTETCDDLENNEQEDIASQTTAHNTCDPDSSRQTNSKVTTSNKAVHEGVHRVSNMDTESAALYDRKLETVTTGSQDGACCVQVTSGENKAGKCRTGCKSVYMLLGLPLMKSPTFLIYTLSVLLWSTGLFVPPTYLPPLANDLDIDSTHGAFLVSIIGISNTVGRVVFGFVSDLPRVDPLVVKTVMVMVGGAATCMVPFLTTFPLLAAYCCLYGSSIGVYVTLRSPVLVDLVGLKNFTNAFGLLYLAHGIGGFLGSPLAVFLADATGDYKLSFIVIGAIFIMAGVLCIPLRRIARWEKNRLK